MQYVKGNNIFGIKWTEGYGYEVKEFNIHEFINGVSTPMVCRFRKYDTIEDSILDHGRLLNFSRYKSVIITRKLARTSIIRVTVLTMSALKT
ncbi:hypothetical protein [Clostridium estertheticum]|uniref:hypothetical protein n=1 Tax=Clostridium estertheticum TaxID=238834 RepID=UPI001CF4D049|nr:hypothetical protein [Clostridium estertheticum]MCB2356115.1 hypothetical protein [Clostridium estertheticum]WAG43734.1 hypothetical protein LL065_23930 [Clostridium estertheticum]